MSDGPEFYLVGWYSSGGHLGDETEPLGSDRTDDVRVMNNMAISKEPHGWEGPPHFSTAASSRLLAHCMKPGFLLGQLPVEPVLSEGVA